MMVSDMVRTGALVVALAATAAAQQSGQGMSGGGMAPPSATGGSMAPGSGSGAGYASPTDLDLPMERPAYVGEEPEPPVEEPPLDDPSDEPPPVLYGEEIVSENDTLVYVIDSSGSMRRDRQSYTTADGQVETGSRMDRAKAEITRSIMGLAPNFRFNIVTYNCNTRVWQQALVPADDANKQAAVAWIESLNPNGGTATGPATALGLGNKDNMAVVLLTDGRPNCGANGHEGHRQVVRTNNTQGAVINVFGIAASGSYREFCQNVAADSGGKFVDVP